MAGPIRRLDQIRALAAPLRLRIVEALAAEARTPKQVAELLRRKPTSLYHHVRVLEAAGLIRQTRTQKKRGTVERYYRAVHHEIRIDPQVFAGRARGGRLALMGSVLSAVEQELRLVEATRPMIGLRLNLDVQPARLRELEALIRAWAAQHGEDSAPYHLAVLAYPGTPAAPRRSRSKPGRSAAGRADGAS